MSLELNFKVTEEQDRFYFIDETGKCNPLNKTGWGSKNDNISDVKSATISITPPKSKTSIELKLPKDFPSDSPLAYEILKFDLDLDKIVSGVWEFKYTVQMNSLETHVSTICCLFTRDIECCLISNLDSSFVLDVDNEEFKKANLNLSTLSAAKIAFCIEKFKESQKLIDQLNKVCNCKC